MCFFDLKNQSLTFIKIPFSFLLPYQIYARYLVLQRFPSEIASFQVSPKLFNAAFKESLRFKP
jgi:hypothetical protein